MAAFSRYYQEQSAHHYIATTAREIKKGILTKATVVAGILARRTRPVKVHLTDTADVVLGDIPLPCGDGIPLLDGDFHGANFECPYIKGEKFLTAWIGCDAQRLLCCWRCDGVCVA